MPYWSVLAQLTVHLVSSNGDRFPYSRQLLSINTNYFFISGVQLMHPQGLVSGPKPYRGQRCIKYSVQGL